MKILYLLIPVIFSITVLSSSKEVELVSRKNVYVDSTQIVTMRAKFVKRQQVRQTRFETPDEINIFELYNIPVGNTKTIISINYGKCDVRKTFFVPGVVYIIKARKILAEYYNISNIKVSDLKWSKYQNIKP